MAATIPRRISMNDEYRPAQLNAEQLDELRQTEAHLRSASNPNIVLIAYEKDDRSAEKGSV
ncbi:hypothetical protein BCM02_110292 [Paenibacillus methanolicus]|uniref:Uncharacterized protein n=2 Tax=Paenibacillus methanolicus TaxID=582686 RepID=A0A5S5BYC6_9BACL|nr:hypothetical protein BCM02_110292 [Paenibacillus methanolicus]